ncbi:acylneuraminate cytidylyltransferase family protein [bacterium]|nr:acylneuraminate cytidylyltransferase family protein [bacterium]
MIKALIPVRAGSQRVKNKNIRPFADSSLLEIKIKQMQRIKELDGVIVNSDSDEMLDIAKSLGAETIKRDSYYASSEVSINEVYVDLANHCDSDVILFADATNPLIKDDTVRLALKKYYDNINEYNSCNTVNVIKMFLWQNGKPINYSEDKKPRSQDLPDIYAINSAINIISREDMIKYRAFVANKPFLLPVCDIEGLDIDNEIDFEFAEFMYKKYRMNNYVKN